jgi:hypothetical protein
VNRRTCSDFGRDSSHVFGAPPHTSSLLSVHQPSFFFPTTSPLNLHTHAHSYTRQRFSFFSRRQTKLQNDNFQQIFVISHKFQKPAVSNTFISLKQTKNSFIIMSTGDYKGKDLFDDAMQEKNDTTTLSNLIIVILCLILSSNSLFFVSSFVSFSCRYFSCRLRS